MSYEEILNRLHDARAFYAGRGHTDTVRALDHAMDAVRQVENERLALAATANWAETISADLRRGAAGADT